MKTINEITEITANSYELKKTWGAQKLMVKATVNIQHTLNNSENYHIEFSRDQISGLIREISCEDREENTTTEHTLTTEAVCDLCRDFLEQ